VEELDVAADVGLAPTLVWTNCFWLHARAHHLRTIGILWMLILGSLPDPGVAWALFIPVCSILFDRMAGLCLLPLFNAAGNIQDIFERTQDSWFVTNDILPAHRAPLPNNEQQHWWAWRLVQRWVCCLLVDKT